MRYKHGINTGCFTDDNAIRTGNHHRTDDIVQWRCRDIQHRGRERCNILCVDDTNGLDRHEHDGVSDDDTKRDGRNGDSCCAECVRYFKRCLAGGDTVFHPRAAEHDYWFDHALRDDDTDVFRFCIRGRDEL